ncbi:MAG: VOC family protein [Propionibacteriaceae bacterium]|jgi:catechol 2,3-dioxygenase-like lactoylglutathione lyase family enzyme|nr:VOC family protein [Propionibacteriaceae bacterium]
MNFQPDSLILYVDRVDLSTEFYRTILGADPVETFDGFAVFALGGGFTIGLQSRHDIEPKPQQSNGGFEICLSNADRAGVDRLYDLWRGRGVQIELEPTELPFGYTFVALDPDGHRLRVCATDTSGLT